MHTTLLGEENGAAVTRIAIGLVVKQKGYGLCA